MRNGNLTLPETETGKRELTDRLLDLLEAGLIEIVLRPSVRGRKAVVKPPEAPAPGEGIGEDLREFLEARVTTAPNQTLTSQELLRAYQAWRGENRLPEISDRPILHALEPAMKETHGLSQRRNIVRNGKQVRGYAGVCLFLTPKS